MTSLRELGEFGFIDAIARMAGVPDAAVIKAIDDDCAVVEVGGPEKLLITVDAALEDRHFDLSWMTPFEVGQRTVAGALSDIAAMGGRPFACLCTVAVPRGLASEQALEIMRGVTATARRYGAPLIGGDTIAAQDHILVDIFALGWAPTPWLRAGAQPGDRLVVTGRLGEAGAALEILLTDPGLLHDPRFADLRQRLMDPTPRVREAAVLSPTGAVHAAIDISDGLYQDAGHIARASGQRLEIEAARLPVATSCFEAGKCVHGDAPWWAATTGEEYELLLCVDKGTVPLLTDLFHEQGLAPLTEIGTVRPGEGVVLVRDDGSEIEMERGGWDHFRTAED